ncbi:MAG: hypothetical protein ACRD68_15395 [Pyrinomonadaceae bacterium]
MRKVPSQRGLKFRVVCSWCGVVIRRAADKDASGMCLACCRRMFNEYLRAGRQHADAFHASDR